MSLVGMSTQLFCQKLE